MSEHEVKRLAQVASALRSKQNSIAKTVATRCAEGMRSLVSMRGDQSALLQIDDDLNVANTIAQLREIFLTFDNNHNDKMEVAEFKQACEWLNIAASDSKLQSVFRKIDTNHDGYISENEFIAHVLSSNKLIGSAFDLDRFEPVSQVDSLLNELSQMRRVMDARDGGDVSSMKRENERLMNENSTLQKQMKIYEKK
jgi:hypothetical protein